LTGQNYCVIGGCLLFLSLCRRGFQDLLKVRPSSLFILCGCISSSISFPDEPIHVSSFSGEEFWVWNQDVLYSFLFKFSDLFAWWWLLYAAETCSCYWIYCNKVCMSKECVITCCYLRFAIRRTSITFAWRCAGNWGGNPVVLTWELHSSRYHLQKSCE